MRGLLFLVGAGLLVYGGYLATKRPKPPAKKGRFLGGGNPHRRVMGPSYASPDDIIVSRSGADLNGVDNEVSMVQHYDSGKNKFPPIGYIGVPVPGYTQDINAIYQEIPY